MYNYIKQLRRLKIHVNHHPAALTVSAAKQMDRQCVHVYPDI